MKYTQEDAKAILELIKSLNISRVAGYPHTTIVYQAIEQYKIFKNQILNQCDSMVEEDCNE